MKYFVYALVAVLIVWSVVYLLVVFHRRMRRKCPHDCASCGRVCRHHNFKKDDETP
ncbi:MAG: hypothetical protein HFF09_08015 [Oscillospiraceae bacterium]|nr:hypothetical protein [Oscillospiraceae bacterium]